MRSKFIAFWSIREEEKHMLFIQLQQSNTACIFLHFPKSIFVNLYRCSIPFITNETYMQGPVGPDSKKVIENNGNHMDCCHNVL